MRKSTRKDKLQSTEKPPVYPLIGEETKKLEALVPVFGRELVDAVAGAVVTGQVRRGSLELVDEGSGQKVRVAFENPSGKKALVIKLSGDWQETQEVPLGSPLISQATGILRRRIKPADENPLATEGKHIAPEDALCVIVMPGKDNKMLVRLPGREFPRGGTLTKFAIADGGDVEKGKTVICYVEKVE